MSNARADLYQINTPTPKDFFLSVISHDYAGDGAYRVGKVMYTDGNKKSAGDCHCAVPREAFLATQSPLILVSNWKLVSEHKLTSRKIVFVVQFRVVAKTFGEGDWSNGQKQRRIILLEKPLEEMVSYDVQMVSGHWQMVDPPLPYVNIKCVIDLTQAAILQLKTIITKLPPSYPKNGGAYQEYTWQKKQLDTLLNIQKKDSMVLHKHI